MFGGDDKSFFELSVPDVDLDGDHDYTDVFFFDQMRDEGDSHLSDYDDDDDDDDWEDDDDDDWDDDDDDF